MLQDLRLFLEEFRNTFHTTGAIAPSSPLLTREILRPLRHRPKRPVRVLEVGPGTGAFTFGILKHLRAGDSLHIYELNPKFHTFLERKLAARLQDPQGIDLRLVNEDIRRLKPGLTYDYIVSGLPFANFDHRTLGEIMDLYLRHLAGDGVLSFFEYLIPHRLRLGFLKVPERRRLIRVARKLRGYSQRHQVLASRVWLNLPPARTRHFRKNAV
jgi:phosphatidylethanolamine/phosphatidyl-N-methylethanolamine N-methyltransferase